jgi:hypothetical protein
MIVQQERAGGMDPSPCSSPHSDLGRVGARLKWFSKRWKFLSSSWINSVLCGYKIPLVGTPIIPRGLPECYGSSSQYGLVQEHVQELLDKNAIYEVDSTVAIHGFTSPLLLVRKKSGQYRPCLDLRYINEKIPYRKFQIESIKQLRQMLREGDFMTSIDLMDGYLHIPIARESQNLLQFSWNGRFYRFQALPFGLASAPWVFTKIIRPIVQLCRSRGIRLMAYLDDFIVLGASQQECMENTQFVLHLLERLGWLVNYKKSSLRPSTWTLWWTQSR